MPGDILVTQICRSHSCFARRWIQVPLQPVFTILRRNTGLKGLTLPKGLVQETTRPTNQVEKPTDGESLHARLVTPLNLPHTPAAARTGEDDAIYQI